MGQILERADGGERLIRTAGATCADGRATVIVEVAGIVRRISGQMSAMGGTPTGL
jgi:hypothetical protein